MDCTLGLLGGISGAGGCGGGVVSGGSMLTISKDEENNINNHSTSAEVSNSSSYPDDDDHHHLELGLGLSIGGDLKTKEEDVPSFISSSSSSSSSFNISNSSISGAKRTAIDSVSPPDSTSVVGWPPIRRVHRTPITANRIKSEHEDYSSSVVNKKKPNGYLSVKVNLDGSVIGRKVDLNAHTSYEMLAQTVEDMFFPRRSSTEAEGCSRLLNETSALVLTYEDKDGDCMLVGDVPWQMFASSVKRLRILRNPKSSGFGEQQFPCRHS